jgi:hypothetical protein
MRTFARLKRGDWADQENSIVVKEGDSDHWEVYILDSGSDSRTKETVNALNKAEGWEVE